MGFWLVDLDPTDIGKSTLLKDRIQATKEFRLLSKKAMTREGAATPHLFQQRRQPSISYLCIPAHVSESRPYFLSERFGADVVCQRECEFHRC